MINCGEAFPVAQQIKNPLSMKETQETQVQSLGQEDPLEEEIAIHYSILAWRILWTEETGRLQSMELQRVKYERPGNKENLVATSQN